MGVTRAKEEGGYALISTCRANSLLRLMSVKRHESNHKQELSMTVRPNSIIANENRNMADQIEIPSRNPIQARLAGLIGSDFYWLCQPAQDKKRGKTKV